jgi:hypothetical protein
MRNLCTLTAPRKVAAVLKRSSGMTPAERADIDDGVRPGGRAHDLATRCGRLIVGSCGVCAAQRFAGRWNAYLALTIAPMIDDHESAGVPAAIVAEHGA